MRSTMRWLPLGSRSVGLLSIASLLLAFSGPEGLLSASEASSTEAAQVMEAQRLRSVAAETWRRSRDEAAALALTRAYFPELFHGDSASELELLPPEALLRIQLPAMADEAMELSTRGYRFLIKQEQVHGLAMRERDGAAFYGAHSLWTAVGGRKEEGAGRWQTPRLEEFIVLEAGAPEHRARYEVTVPEGITEVRDAGAWLEFLDARAVPVVRMHGLVARDSTGLSRQGQTRLFGVSALPGRSERAPVRYALDGRTLRVEMTVSLEGLSGPLVIDPAWSSTSSLAQARQNHIAELLPSGKVLVAGGRETPLLDSAELYDPATGTWSATGRMYSAKGSAASVLLPSGKVLIAGGNTFTGATELYDPATGTWSRTGDLTTIRSSSKAVLLSTGKVLLAGGYYGQHLSSAELYDPATNRWTATGSLNIARSHFSLTRLPSGKVLAAGGDTPSGFGTNSVELYDPATGTWSVIAPMATGRRGPTATLLPSGKVLVAGGGGTTSQAELFDPATNTWSPAGAMTDGGGQFYTATLLPSGHVLTAGNRAELYDPVTSTWRQVGSLRTSRTTHTATLLPSGKVLAAGGYGSGFLASAELYDPANFAPVAQSSSATVAEDVSTSFAMQVTDPDRDPLTASVLSGPANGTLTVTGTTFTYVPSLNFNGTDSFTAKASDGALDSNTVTITLTVTPVNDAPQARNLSFTTAEDTPVATVLQGTDVDGDSLTYTVVLQPRSGSLSGTAPNLTYTPNANFVGSDSFTYRTSDGQTNSATATVTLTVTPVDDPPTAVNLSLPVTEDTPQSVVLRGSDVDGDPLTFQVVTQPQSGALSGTAPNLTYTPSANFTGTDSFTYRAMAGGVASNVATVTLTVAPSNDAPQARDLSVTLTEDTRAAVVLQGTDVDGDALTYQVVTQPRSGTLSGTAPNLNYTPNADFAGTDSFIYRVNDGRVNSLSATVTLTVSPVDDAPQARNVSLTTDEDTPLSVVLQGIDVDGDALTYQVLTQPQSGTLSGTAPDLIYNPSTNFTGTASFTYRVVANGVVSNVGTVTLSVTPINDAPQARNLSITTAEDTATAVVLQGTDVEGDPLTYQVEARPRFGTLSGTAPNLTYTPNANFTGTDSLTYRVYDARVGSPLATVTITVAGTNDPPVAADSASTLPEDGARLVTLSVSDSDGDTLTFTIVSGPAHGSLSGTAPNLTYRPNPNFHGTDSFTFKASDGSSDSNVATVTLTVTPVNDPAQAQNLTVSTAEDTPVEVTLIGTDADGDDLTYTLVSTPRYGSLSGTPPNLTYTPYNNVYGVDTFAYEVVDGSVFPSRATVAINVTSVNDPPLALDWEWSTTEDTPMSERLIAIDVDYEQQLTYRVVTPPAHGSLSGTAPDLTYTPFANFSGTDTFTFKVSDGVAESPVATISIQVAAVEDAPVAHGQSLMTRQGQALQVTLNATDADGDAVTYTVVSGPAHGTLSGTAPNLTYTPSEGFIGPDSFTFKASDGRQESNVATLSILVTQEPPPPPPDPHPGEGCGCSGASGGAWPFWGALMLLGLGHISRRNSPAPRAQRAERRLPLTARWRA